MRYAMVVSQRLSDRHEAHQQGTVSLVESIISMLRDGGNSSTARSTRGPEIRGTLGLIGSGMIYDGDNSSTVRSTRGPAKRGTEVSIEPGLLCGGGTSPTVRSARGPAKRACSAGAVRRRLPDRRAAHRLGGFEIDGTRRFLLRRQFIDCPIDTRPINLGRCEIAAMSLVII